MTTFGKDHCFRHPRRLVAGIHPKGSTDGLPITNVGSDDCEDRCPINNVGHDRGRWTSNEDWRECQEQMAKKEPF